MYNIIGWMQSLAEGKHKAGLISQVELTEQLAGFDTLQQTFHNVNSRPEKFQEAMSASSFGTYMTDALSRQFYNQYSVLSHDFNAYTTPDTTSDFREVTRYTRTMNHGMQKRRATGSNRQTSHDVVANRYRLGEYTEKFELPWQVLLDDDLGEMKKVPDEMAREASQFEGRFVSSLYHNATTQAALIALGAQYAGATALSKTSLVAGIVAMTTRAKANGDIIDTGGITLVVGKGLVYDARELMANIIAYGNPGSLATSGGGVSAANITREFIGNVVVNPNIVNVAGNEPWYLFADKRVINTVPVLRLAGVTRPFVYTQASQVRMISGTAPRALLMGDADNGMIEYTVETIIGGNADATNGGVVDVNGIYYNAGGV